MLEHVSGSVMEGLGEKKNFEVRNKSGLYHQMNKLNAGLLELQEQVPPYLTTTSSLCVFADV